MKLDFTQINGKQIQVTDMEYLYTYTNKDGEKIAVFEYQGEQIQKKVVENVAS
jgi:hypothetical protein